MVGNYFHLPWHSSKRFWNFHSQSPQSAARSYKFVQISINSTYLIFYTKVVRHTSVKVEVSEVFMFTSQLNLSLRVLLQQPLAVEGENTVWKSICPSGDWYNILMLADWSVFAWCLGDWGWIELSYRAVLISKAFTRKLGITMWQTFFGFNYVIN